MLLTNEVEVSVGRMKQYYEDKGYIIPTRKVRGVYRPQRNTKIIVKVDDLPKGSHAIISWQCDKCQNIYNEVYKEFLRHKFDENKCYCFHCASSIYTSRGNHYLWKQELSNEDRKNNRNRRCNLEYTLFIRTVLNRDKCICYKCGKTKNGHMVVHHLYNYADYPELRTDINNGVCLCEDCHNIFHRIYGKSKNTKEQFEEWINNSLNLSEKEIQQIEQPRLVYCLEDDEIIYNLTYYCKTHKGCYTSSIRKNCNQLQSNVNGKHYLWYDVYCNTDDIDMYIDDLKSKCSRTYDQYIKMKNNDNFKAIKKQVVCIELKLLFDTVSDATKYIGLKSCGSISMACTKGKIARNYHWCFINDYSGDICELKRIVI